MYMPAYTVIILESTTAVYLHRFQIHNELKGFTISLNVIDQGLSWLSNREYS